MDLYFLILLRIFVTNYEQSLQRMQPLKSDLCGQYCLYYAFVKCNGLSMDEIIYNILLYKAFPQTCTDTYCFLCVS